MADVQLGASISTDRSERAKLPLAGYADAMLWGKVEDVDGEDHKYGIFPTTRYRNVMNRPRLIMENQSVSDTANADFHLVCTDVEVVDDEEVFSLFKQAW